MRANIRDKSSEEALLMSGKFSQHDLREQVLVVFLHFCCKCGLTNSKLAVLVSRYAQRVGVEKDKILPGL
jgi:hypothetical protein